MRSQKSSGAIIPASFSLKSRFFALFACAVRNHFRNEDSRCYDKAERWIFKTSTGLNRQRLISGMRETLLMTINMNKGRMCEI